MKRPTGIYLTAGAMLLTYPFHICIASVAIGTTLAKLLVTTPYQDLVGMVFFIAGVNLTTLLAIGIFSRNRAALFASIIVFLGGTGGAIFCSGNYQNRLDIVIGLTTTGICLASAGYVWRAARQPNKVPPKLRC